MLVLTMYFVILGFFVVPSSPPENVSIIVIDATSIHIDWSEVPEIDQNGIITKYEVVFEPLTTFGILMIENLFVDSTNLSISLVDLEEYVEYNISVRAYTSVGPGPYSEETIVLTEEAGQFVYPFYMLPLNASHLHVQLLPVHLKM